MILAFRFFLWVRPAVFLNSRRERDFFSFRLNAMLVSLGYGPRSRGTSCWLSVLFTPDQPPIQLLTSKAIVFASRFTIGGTLRGWIGRFLGR